jgi:hypothetical protein
MSHSQCPNIKNDILQLRSKIGELRELKSHLLKSDDSFDRNLARINREILDLIDSVDKKSDEIENEAILPGIIESGQYKDVGNFLQGRARVVARDNSWFHINFNSKPAYTQKYDCAYDYSQGRALVKDAEDSYFHIDRSGNPAYAQRYVRAGNYSQDGWAWVRDKDGNEFHINLNGKR